MRRLTLFMGWLVVVVVATAVTWQIVSAADAQVTERPIAPLNVAAPVVTDGADSTTTTTPPRTTTSTGAGSSSTSTTASTSTSTTEGTTWQARAVQTAGGTVHLRYRPGEVAYQSATPAPGFQVEVDRKGPPDVRVEFESESKKIEVKASWDNGELRVETSGETDDD